MLLARSAKVIPNGMWGHMATRMIAPGYPQFFAEAEGCRVRDVDGNEYIDFMCAWGPMVLGYVDPDVERAAEAQRRLGDALNFTAEDIPPHYFIPPLSLQLLIENDRLRAAVNRIYYGMFYSLLALGLAYQFETSKHNQL